MEGGGRRDQEIFSRSLGSVQLDRHPEEEPRVTAEGAAQMSSPPRPPAS